MTLSNRLGITELEETQNSRSVTINEAIAKLEAGATFFAAIQVLLDTPPASPVEGDLYVVGTAGTGAWSGHNENVTIYYNAAWLFFVPFEGMFAWDQTSNTLKRHDGTDWVAYTVGAGGIADGDYGDITVSSSGSVWTVDNDAVTNAKLANMAQSTIKGRAAGAGTGDPVDLTATQGTAILDVMVGDSGAGGTKGLVPAPGSGDAAAGKFLKADGTFAVPPGTGSSTGKHTIWLPASAMLSATTSGPGSSQFETTTNDINFMVLDFDASADEHAHFNIAFPKGWDEGTVTFQVWWTTTASDTDGVAWGLQAVAISDNEAGDASWGTAVVVTDDAQSAAGEILVTAESGAVTIAGTPAEGDICFFRLFRDISDANDDMTEDARLIGVKVFYTTNAGNDA